jgi:hypothetical protein
MRVGERIIEGVIQERAAAKANCAIQNCAAV